MIWGSRNLGSLVWYHLALSIRSSSFNLRWISVDPTQFQDELNFPIQIKTAVWLSLSSKVFISNKWGTKHKLFCLTNQVLQCKLTAIIENSKKSHWKWRTRALCRNSLRIFEKKLIYFFNVLISNTWIPMNVRKGVQNICL